MPADMDEQRSELVRGKAGQWAKSLIELGPKNTLLHFKNTQKRSLDLTNAESAEVRNLLRGNGVRLSALYPDTDAHKDASTRARNLRRTMHTFAEEQGIDVGKLAQGLVKATPREGAATGAAAPRGTRAPLLLKSLRIDARTVAENEFVLTVGNDVEVNPVLLYALDQDYGLDLDIPAFTGKVDGLLADTDDPLQQLDVAYRELATVAEAQNMPLSLERALVCGLFNYDKQPMVEDLHTASELLAGHDLVASLAGHEPSKQEVGAPSAGFTAPGADEIDPVHEFLVQDADSSQQQAVSTALAGHDVLIEGPPGTGKSQTIANIIAGAAARGKRVLFVSEKRAAIEAVTNRLAQAGLEKLVFDLHQRKMDKKHIARQLYDSLDTTGRQTRPEPADTHRKLTSHRTALRAHSDELHQKRDPWGISAYEVQSELLDLRCSTTLGNFRGSVLRALDRNVIQQLEQDLHTFVDIGGLRVVRKETPWWQAEIRDADDIRNVLHELDDLATDTLQRGQQSMVNVLHKTGLRTPQNLAGWEEVLHLLDEVNGSVEAFGGDVFASCLDDWYFATATGRERARAGHKLGWLTRRRLLKDVRAASGGITQRRVLHGKLARVREQRDRWQELGDRHGRPSEVVGLQETMELFRTLRNQLTSVALCAKMSDVDKRPTEQVGAEIEQLREDKQMLWHMEQVNRLLDDFTRLGLVPLIEDVARRDLNGDQAWELFRYLWLNSLQEQFKLDSQVLREFAPQQHGRRVRDYRDADAEHLRSAKERVRYEVARALRQVRDDYQDETQLLRAQANKKSRHLPLRDLVGKAEHVLLALRPCWAMSPLVVSRTLPAKQLFDMVVFDEASQIQPHDAIATIARGRRLVVAGDDKQLPPSNYFGRMLESTDDEDDDGALQDYESILSTMRSLLPNRVRLRWHYRSTDERLIAFSNREIYDGDLVTFPGTAQETPISLQVVDGVASPGQRGSAPAEVDAVVRLVLEHAELRPEQSLGVIALGNSHAERVQAAVRRALQDRPDLQEFCAEDGDPAERFFVKNLERVQGDERDAIILTVGVAKTATGRIDGRSFGPLNNEGGRRRLNVAVTRAKSRMTVVSSFGPEHLAPSEDPTGTELLRRYLEFAQANGEVDVVGRQQRAELNGFEQDVHDALLQRGIEVHPQWGFSGYRIDFALAHRDRPGQMVLAVEADGDSYHRMTSVRDRDRLRQAHLERLGWRFHRVWASAWFADRADETEKIVKAWEEAMLEPDRDTPEPEPPKPAQPAPEPESHRGRRPDVVAGQRIDDYSDADLISICRWLLRDGLQLDRAERLSQALQELGFRRRGRKIVERLTRAIEIAQDQADKEEQ